VVMASGCDPTVSQTRGGGRSQKLRRHGATRTDVAMGHSNEGAASCRAEEGFVRGRPSRKSPRQNFEIVIAKTFILAKASSGLVR
jgi:hypothetical protein